MCRNPEGLLEFHGAVRDKSGSIPAYHVPPLWEANSGKEWRWLTHTTLHVMGETVKKLAVERYDVDTWHSSHI